MVAAAATAARACSTAPWSSHACRRCVHADVPPALAAARWCATCLVSAVHTWINFLTKPINADVEANDHVQQAPTSQDASGLDQGSCAAVQLTPRSRRRLSLLQSSAKLLRRMTHPPLDGASPQGGSAQEHGPGSGSTYWASGLSSSGAQGSAASLRASSSGAEGSKPGGAGPAAHVSACRGQDPPARTCSLARAASTERAGSLARSVSLGRTGSLPQAGSFTAAQVARQSPAELAALLDGGLIGRAMSASAAWHAMQHKLAELELHERQEMIRPGPWSSRAGNSRRASDGARTTAGACASSAALPSMPSMPAAGTLLPTLAEEEDQGQQAEAWLASEEMDRAGAEALIAAFADAEVRQYLQRQLSRIERDRRRMPGPRPERSAAGGQSMAQLSVEATAGGNAGFTAAWTQDPVLKAWLVTRAAPDLPVRGWVPPPGRAACRLVAAKEMQE